MEAPEDGYFGDTTTAQKTFEALKTTRLERDEWRNAVFLISGDVEAVRTDMKGQLNNLNDSFNKERKAIKRQRTINTVIGLVLGGIAGLVIGNN